MNKLIDDPRITLYALGQMSEEEQKEFLMEINNDPEVMAEIESIKKTGNILSEELSLKADTRLEPERIEAISKIYSKKKSVWFIFGIGSATALSLLFAVIFLGDSPRLSKKVSLSDGVFNKADDMVSPASSSYNNYSMPEGALYDSTSDQKSFDSFGGNGFGIGRLRGTEAEKFNTETYDHVEKSDFLRATDHPLSTFSSDVDTASYSNMRRFLNQGSLPPKESVRVEEFINYFDYGYIAPTEKDEHPIRIYTEMANSPYNSKYKLVKIGLKAREFLAEKRPASNLVFLIDVSGSMEDPNKLPLVKEAMKLMVRKMDKQETISIVVYAGAAGLVLPPTSAGDVTPIFEALNKLQAGGSTNGGSGIELAYKLAKEKFIKEGNNRVILVTDGDFNIGTTSQGSLIEMIEEKAKDNIYLTVLGVGMGNLKDSTLEKLSAHGNGNYAYIDSLSEAKKVLIEDRFKTLHAMAKDVKIQVEFNPQNVEAYRLIGYENRKLANQDFNNDKKDAGDMGAGHEVTALYEIVPKGVAIDLPGVDKLKYQKTEDNKPAEGVDANELMNVKIRYKTPTGNKSKLVQQSVNKEEIPFEKATPQFKFASAVAGFAMILREDDKISDINLSELITLAKENKGDDPNGHREEFIENMGIAQKMAGKAQKWK